MDKKNLITLVDDSILFLIEDKRKEWSCHVQFVRDIALYLQTLYGGDPLVIEVASILHDIGRGREKEGEHHNITGVREGRAILDMYDIDENKKELILQCIKNHGAEEVPQTIEEKIIISADSASKLAYHSCFMLMCKKEDIVSRARWGLKYIEKGYKKIQIQEYKDTFTKFYQEQKVQYEKVIGKRE